MNWVYVVQSVVTALGFVAIVLVQHLQLKAISRLERRLFCEVRQSTSSVSTALSADEGADAK